MSEALDVASHAVDRELASLEALSNWLLAMITFAGGLLTLAITLRQKASGVFAPCPFDADPRSGWGPRIPCGRGIRESSTSRAATAPPRVSRMRHSVVVRGLQSDRAFHVLGVAIAAERRSA